MKKNNKIDSPEAVPYKTDSDDPNLKKPQRFSAKLKSKIFMRFLRGESIELLAREYCTTAAKISKWRDDFLDAGEEALKKRPKKEKDREISRLKEKLGDTTMENELLYEKIRRMENGRPLAPWRSKK